MSIKAKPRGVFERPLGSGVWWIQYFADGKRHREKIGRQSDAKKKYDERKAEARAGVWRPSRHIVGVTLGELIDDALLFVVDHKDRRNYVSKAGIVRPDWGHKSAASITPQEIDVWLKDHTETAATANRYKAFFSLCYRQGIANGKVSINPVRSVRHRKEPKGRHRFLSRAEYDRLREIISRRFPEHLAEFVVSVYTGMRAGEQYSITWRQVHFDRKTIELIDTKNDEPRTVHLNAAALEALHSIKPEKTKPSDVVFPREAEAIDNRAWFFPCLEEAGIDVEEYTWHNNRHTFGSWLALSGASIKEIQEAGGWKSIQMAARYAHLSPQHTANVVNRLG